MSESESVTTEVPAERRLEVINALLQLATDTLHSYAMECDARGAQVDNMVMAQIAMMSLRAMIVASLSPDPQVIPAMAALVAEFQGLQDRLHAMSSTRIERVSLGMMLDKKE